MPAPIGLVSKRQCILDLVSAMAQSTYKYNGTTPMYIFAKINSNQSQALQESKIFRACHKTYPL